MAKIHVRNWTGDNSATITDMANAGKRGKVCQRFHLQGYHYHGSREDAQAMASERGIFAIAGYVAKLAGKKFGDAIDVVIDGDYAEVVAEISRMAAEAKANGAYSWAFNSHADEIKGIDAPKPKLVAGNDKFSASADNDGIHIADHTDKYNEPREITHNQTNAKAYAIAAKVWDQVKAAADFRQASQILSAAGARLHYYCAMD